MPRRIVRLRGERSPKRAWTNYEAAYLEDAIQILREHSPGGWHPSIELRGIEHINGPQASGRGVILWVGVCRSSFLVTKKAFAEAGLGVIQLSRPSHGFANTEFARQYLNRIWTSAEDRYLTERVVIRGASATVALRTLRDRLREGGIVEITVGPQSPRLHRVPFIGCDLLLPGGPVKLAAMTGAELLPVFTIREGPGRFIVQVEPPLPLPTRASSTADIEETLLAYAARLERYLERSPDAWWGWRNDALQEPAWAPQI